MIELNKRSWKWLTGIVSLMGTLLLALLTILWEEPIKGYEMPKFILDNWGYQLVSVCALAVAVYLYFENRVLKTADNIEKTSIIKENVLLKSQINKFIKPDEKNIRYLRFEQLKDAEGITYGHIDYDPFFKLIKKPQSAIYEPSGIGYEVLKEIFSVLDTSIVRYDNSSNWGNLFEGLEAKKYDVIVTPLYETRTRLYSHNIMYCVPLFYSEVGMFVHPDDFDDFEQRLTLRELKSEIEQGSKQWQSPYIVGEISEIIARKSKILLDEISGKVNDDPNAFEILLKKVNDKKDQDNFKFNIVAMEVFKAHSIMHSVNDSLDSTLSQNNNRKLILVNILKEKQLLYPVSFVVRKEDTVLRNFINLRIAEIRDRDSVQGGQQNLIDIIKSAAMKTDGIDPNYVDASLIQYYDFSTLESQK